MSERKEFPRIMIAAAGSGSGKTTVTCGLLYLLKQMGKKPVAFKCGPDYIDPLFHRETLGIDTGNLDGFFMEPETLKRILAEESRNAGIAVVEGVMGYYDGIGMNSCASSAAVAKTADLPVILVLDCKGMAASVGAVLKGFLSYRAEGEQIRGVIFNRMPISLYEQAAKLAEEQGCVPLGFIPEKAEMKWESRHLGLVKPDEVTEFQEKIKQIAEQLEKSLDLPGIIKLAESALPLKSGEFSDASSGNAPPFNLPEHEITGSHAVKIGIAKDEAFCFYYRENLEYLKKAGCEPVFFSPLRDKELPECHGLILPGGYPELYGKELSENVSMRNSIKEHILEKKLPCIAECGGFLYLHNSLEDAEGRSFPMAGVFPFSAKRAGRTGRFGYVKAAIRKKSIFTEEAGEIKGHEFHYWDSEKPGTDLSVQKPGNGKTWETGYLTEMLYAGFVHIPFYGNEKAAAHFLEAAEKYRKRKENSAEHSE